MTTFKRFAHSLALTLIIPLAFAVAQTPSVSTVNVTPDERKVRIAAVGDVLDMRVAVSDESGDVVFESGPVIGGALDWAMRDPQGRRVPAGAYTLTVTYRAANGKLKRRVEQVLVAEEVTPEGGAEKAEAQAAPAPEPLAPTGSGTAGRVAKWTTATNLGNSVITESSGRVGVGPLAPVASLHVSGAATHLRLQSSATTALTMTEYLTNNRLWMAGAGGSGAAGGVAGKFFVRDNNANQYRLVIDTAGNFGVGTTVPTSRLTVNGGIQLLGAGNGIRFPDGSIQTKATAGTINGTGVANRLAKFTGPNSFGNSSVTEVSGRVGIGTASPVTQLDVRGHLTLDAGGSPALFTSSLSGEQNRYLQLLNSLSSPSASGLKAGGVLVADSYDYANPRKNDLIVKGMVGIGTPEITSILDVRGEGGTQVMQAISSGLGTALYASSATGYAGRFHGKVSVEGTFENNSDRAAKANISSVSPRSILQKLINIPVQTWNYKSESASIRHLGPMAQDFRAAFGLGTDDKTISVVDASGVALASVQALYQLVLEKDKQNQELARKVEQQNLRIERLEARLDQGRRNIRGRRAAKR